MTQLKRQRSLLAFWTWGGRREPATGVRRRRRPAVEPLESRQLLSTIAEFPMPTANSSPFIDRGRVRTATSGSPRLLANKIGMINPTTHATADFATPTADSEPERDRGGARRQPLVHRAVGNKIGMINPTTHAITEFPIPTADCRPRGIAAGPDGNLWFTEYDGNKIGTINPTTHAITEFPIPTADSAAVRDRGGARRQPLVHRVDRQQDRDDQPDHPRHHRVPHPDRRLQPRSGSRRAPTATSGSPRTAATRSATINPTTHAITEIDLPDRRLRSPSASRRGPTATSGSPSAIGNKIGTINPITRGITETAVPTATAGPRGIAAGPDGNLWFAETDGQKIGVLDADAQPRRHGRAARPSSRRTPPSA